MSTPALDRAKSELGNAWTDEQAETIARDVVSAALHDPDGAIVEALRTEFAYRMRTSAAHGRAGRAVEAIDIALAAQCALDKARAAILGEA